jgi:hypothetical protein
MRNYTTLNYIRVNYNFSSPSDPATNTIWILGLTLDDANSQAQRAAAGTFTIVDIEDLGIWYVLLDRVNISRLINGASFGRNIGDAFFADGGVLAYPADPPRDQSRPRQDADGKFASSNTPRSTGWTDADLVTRPPQGNEAAKPAPATGPPGEGDAFVAFLQNLLVNMLDAGRINDAAYVQYLLDQYLAGNLSQADVLSLLLRNHIP